MPSLEDQLKDRLNLKYKAASKLVQEAKDDLGVSGVVKPDRENEVLGVATSKFNELPKYEQEEMVVGGDGDISNELVPGETPEWQQKAKAAAEKREAEWAAAAAADDNHAISGTSPDIQQQQQQLPPNVVKQTVTTRIGKEEPTVDTVTQEKELVPPNEDNTKKTTCYCAIL
mmetsp:Transcript_3082/g.4155  ORF Transcript_3082/g.4155 Transcript_3082/m.4155 type:complete len:172 (-) Transcript_3082:156-671(-)|eukprot:CAMPEP_0198147462 /NCGR_PEP_ID=MMETSP1443-20131203/35929_1 /TAXON_ID=186043 /ORGANISM="Entomoneis sp., Strain CCMP2396" /LENGTH=171 /DNA_ID=CAMNT_0043811815 /DNA_START=37 /DNA_END=552 /DNA_ORIENTATION=+